MLHPLDLMNTLMSKHSLNLLLGATKMVKTIFPGAETNTSQLTVDHVGLMEQQAQSLTELTLLEMQLGQI